MRGADRARLVALNYFVAPAREAGKPSVTIRAGDLHDMSGLVKNWANVCQALEGEIFQQMASVPAPTRSGPERSTTDVYQMMAYAHLYKAPRLTLLYPHHMALGDAEGIRARFRVTGQETLPETASFDISTGADLVDRIRGRILAGIQEMSPALP